MSSQYEDNDMRVTAQDFIDSRDELRSMVIDQIHGRAFSELSGIAFDQKGSNLAGEVLFDTLAQQGISANDFDCVGALTAAAVPFAIALVNAAEKRGQKLDAFVMDFVFPGIKGTSVDGKKVMLLDAWLSEKSYIQTSSVVTLRPGNELNLDLAILERHHATIVGVAAIVGGITQTENNVQNDELCNPLISVTNVVNHHKTELPFIYIFDQNEVCDSPIFPVDSTQKATSYE